MFDKLKKSLENFSKKISKPKEIKEKEPEEKKEEAKPEEKPLEIEEEKPKLKEVQKVESKVGFIESLTKAVTETKISEDYFERMFSQFEPELLQNNVALEVVHKLHDNLKSELVGKPLPRKDIGNIVKKSLKDLVNEIFETPKPLDFYKIIEDNKKEGKPTILLFVGTNGHGKTSTIAKIANTLKQKGYTSVFAASDTFRAAAYEQLAEHADKLGIKVIKHKPGADPAAVAFDCVKHANAQNIDVAIIDTAGRQHTNKNLMDELKKIKLVAKPDLTIFVVESIAGNDAWTQEKTYNDAIKVDGVILTKVDVDDRGGTAISLVHKNNKPILFVTYGQNYEDIKPFKVEDFIRGLGL